MNDARTWFDRVLEPALEEWSRDSLAEHRAFAVALFASALVERLFLNDFKRAAKPGEIGPYWTHLVRKCPELAIVRDMADATKHIQLRRSDRVLSTVGGTGTVLGAPIDDWEDFDSMPSVDLSSYLIVSLDNGAIRQIPTIFARSIKALRDEMAHRSL